MTRPDNCRCVSIAGDISDIVCPIHGTSREDMVPCTTCGNATRYTGTQLCDICWQCENRLAAYLANGGANARKFVIAALEDQDRKRVVRRWDRRHEYRETVAFDFDGVIHRNVSKWTVPHEINDDEVEGALDFIELVMTEFDVIIFSARANDPIAEAAIGAWLCERWTAAGKDPEVLGEIGITARKPHAFVYIDDCGWRFDGRFPTMEELRESKSWTKKAREGASTDVLRLIEKSEEP